MSSTVYVLQKRCDVPWRYILWQYYFSGLGPFLADFQYHRKITKGIDRVYVCNDYVLQQLTQLRILAFQLNYFVIITIV